MATQLEQLQQQLRELPHDSEYQNRVKSLQEKIEAVLREARQSKTLIDHYRDRLSDFESLPPDSMVKRNLVTWIAQEQNRLSELTGESH